MDRYRAMRERADTPPAAGGLKIVLAGELAYNAERVLALEERGHTRYGLWMPEPHSLNVVGPVPFGHVEDLPRDDWIAALGRVRPDVIPALLNWQAVPFAHAVMERALDVPLVWHFREGPFICIEKGTCPLLADLTRRADGVIFSSLELAGWYQTVVPSTGDQPTMVLDGDLPKRDWFTGGPSPLLSDANGEVHSAVAGRPIGLHPETVQELAEHGIHLHDTIGQEDWVGELSRYDTGWLHAFPSRNDGDLSHANWDDLNYSARIATYVVAGVSQIQADNAGSIVATQALCDRRGLGVAFTSIPHVAAQLKDRPRMAEIRDRVWTQRDDFTFDAHADCLVAFLRQAVASAAHGTRRGHPCGGSSVARPAAVAPGLREGLVGRPGGGPDRRSCRARHVAWVTTRRAMRWIPRTSDHPVRRRHRPPRAMPATRATRPRERPPIGAARCLRSTRATTR